MLQAWEGWNNGTEALSVDLMLRDLVLFQILALEMC